LTRNSERRSRIDSIVYGTGTDSESTTPDSAPYLSMQFFGSYNPGGEASEPDAIAPVIRTVDCDGTERYFDFSGR